MNVIETLKNPYKILAWLSTKGFFKNMDDEKYMIPMLLYKNAI